MTDPGNKILLSFDQTKSYTRGLGDDATSCKFNTVYCVNDP